MIPASYFFRDVYRREWLKDERQNPPARAAPGRRKDMLVAFDLGLTVLLLELIRSRRDHRDGSRG